MLNVEQQVERLDHVAAQMKSLMDLAIREGANVEQAKVAVDSAHAIIQSVKTNVALVAVVAGSGDIATALVGTRAMLGQSPTEAQAS